MWNRNERSEKNIVRRLTRTFLAAALGAMLLAAPACETTQKTGQNGLADGQAVIEDSTATLVVHGMGCPLCANNVDKQLLAVNGVRDVQVDLGSGRVTVHLDDQNRPTRDQLSRAVRESGFTLVSIETP